MADNGAGNLHRDRMYGDMNEYLEPNDGLLSASGTYLLTYMESGNLVICQLSDQGSGVVWSANTDGVPAWRVYMQPDGNFCVYQAFGQSVFSTHTSSNPNGYVVMEDTGQLVVYDVNDNSVWSSGPPSAIQAVSA
jgi:hypothetical protein